MGLAASMNHRPIRGAVATLGVSERVAFLRRTYGLLGIALIAFAAIAGGMMKFAPETSLGFSKWALQGQWTWLAVLAMFMVVGVVAERMARSDTSRTVQMIGLGIAVTAQAILLQPLLWVCIARFGATGANSLILNATLITLIIFIGLTATVFISKKDFSFLRGILMVCSFAALGVILASAIFGFALGAVFVGLMIALMAGYILFQTSMVMKDFPPTHHVAAALMLFSTVATLFWYVLQLLMSLRE
jgi:FtsH-binding integral membrane protein